MQISIPGDFEDKTESRKQCYQISLRKNCIWIVFQIQRKKTQTAFFLKPDLNQITSKHCLLQPEVQITSPRSN
jgi:hypothetical protein